MEVSCLVAGQVCCRVCHGAARSHQCRKKRAWLLECFATGSPRSGRWTGTFFPVENNEPPWNFGLGWAAVTVWLLIMVGVLVVRLSVFRGLRAENRWVFEHGVPYSIHRSSVDYDDGETSGWPTYIALNHRLDGSVAKIGGSQR